MKILLVSTLKRKIGPDITASRSRIIFELAQGLLKKGHDVSVLGTGDSILPGGTIIPVIPQSLVELPVTENPFYTETGYLVQLAKKIEEYARGFDIIHNHTYPEFINLLVGERLATPMLTTVHAQATPEFDETLSKFPRANLVALSLAHKNLFKKTSFIDLVYNGIDTTVYSYQEKKGDYLLWLGRLSKAKASDGSFLDSKGVKWAIKLAQETGEKLILSGNVEDMAFYEQEIKPHLNESIQWFGPVSQEQALTREEVIHLMQNAKAFLMTINWEEPFGLVMAEAMSCGTPIIGFDKGAVSEIVKDGETGFVVPYSEGVEGLKHALAKLPQIKPQVCREHVENNFTIEHMVENYEKVYNKVLGEKR